eukprot:scaffold6807_cov220-Amphora_coffeaeformis.AAC.23
MVVAAGKKHLPSHDERSSTVDCEQISWVALTKRGVVTVKRITSSMCVLYHQEHEKIYTQKRTHLSHSSSSSYPSCSCVPMSTIEPEQTLDTNITSDNSPKRATTSFSGQEESPYVDWFDESDAERGLFTSIEGRRTIISTQAGDVWHSAAGLAKRPPLAAVATQWEQQIIPPCTDDDNTKPAPSHDTTTTTRSASGHGMPRSQPQLHAPSHGDHKSTPTHAGFRKIARKVLTMSKTARAMGAVPASASASTTTTTTADNGDPPTSSILTSTAAVATDSAPVPGVSRSQQQSHRKTTSRAHALLNLITEDDEDNMDTGRTSSEEGLPEDSPSTNDEKQKKSDTASGTLDRRNSIWDQPLLRKASLLRSHRSLLSMGTANTDRLFDGASAVDELLENTATSTDTTTSDTEVSTAQGSSASSRSDSTTHAKPTNEAITQDESESLPLIHPPLQKEGYGSAASSTSSLGGTKRVFRARRQSGWQRWRRKLLHCLNPCHFLRWLVWRVMFRAYFFLASIPLFATSWILSHNFQNPVFDFLPGEHTPLAWWFNFTARLCLTMEMARLFQWVLVDQILLGMSWAARWMGPLVTLHAIQARGWPFLIATWSIINMFMICGGQDFASEWFIDLTLTNDINKHAGRLEILKSPEWLLCLVALLIAGLFTSVKRTMVAMFFGRPEFKPRLEKLLKEVVLLSEVSDLAAAINQISHPEGGDVEIELSSRKVKFFDDVWATQKAPRKGSVAESDDGSESMSLERPSDKSSKEAARPAETTDDRGGSGRNSSRSLPIKALLEYWDEPVNKLDRSLNASVKDILKFRRALTFMEEKYPFGEAFGPARSRDDVVASAYSVYQSLMQSSDDHALSIDVLFLLAEHDDNGTVTVDRAKMKALRKFFRPDAHNHIPMLTFVQACDSLYKRMRFFRASVGNASVIEAALEDILDGFYNFFLILLILCILRMNPWPLLFRQVLLDTLRACCWLQHDGKLKCSIFFCIEMKYLTNVRRDVYRPFDLGDRVYMSDPNKPESEGIGSTWFIEDMGLFTTTIRYARTNEVATINNGSIAMLRIVNCNRSPNAIFVLKLDFKLALIDDDKLKELRAFLDSYVKQHPNEWNTVIYCRVADINYREELVEVTIGVQSRFPWQELGRIAKAKALLRTKVYKFGRDAGLNYDELPSRKLNYDAGRLREGGTIRNRSDLHKPTNIVSATAREQRGSKGGLELLSENQGGSRDNFLSLLRASHPPES